MSEPRPQNEEEYCFALWQWFQGILTIKPPASDYGLNDVQASGLERQCKLDWFAKREPMKSRL